jgi:hypothetical protein
LLAQLAHSLRSTRRSHGQHWPGAAAADGVGVMAAMVEIKNLCKRFGPIVAVDGTQWGREVDNDEDDYRLSGIRRR